jgi:hypothetical protein
MSVSSGVNKISAEGQGKNLLAPAALWEKKKHVARKLEQGVQPGRAGAFFKGHMQTATQAADKLENGFRFRFEDSLHDQLPVRIPKRHEIVA